MEDRKNAKIVFPSDHERWNEIRSMLIASKASRSADAWIAAFQRAHDIVHPVADRPLVAETGAKMKRRNIFSGLKLFLDEKATVEERYECIDRVLPEIVDLALAIETLKPIGGLVISQQQTESVTVISTNLAASILACAFLCLFPGRCSSLNEPSKLGAITFDDFFNRLENDVVQCETLHCVLRYFSELQHRPVGNLIFTRQVLRRDRTPKLNDWKQSKQMLCPVFVNSSTKKSNVCGSLQVVIRSQNFGGSELLSGRSEDVEIFCEHPQLISGMLFIETLMENESISVSGLNFSDSSQNVNNSEAEEQRTSLCLIDTLPRNPGEPLKAFKEQSIAWMLTRFLIAFLQTATTTDNNCPSNAGAETDAMEYETSEADLALTMFESLTSSSSYSCGHPKPPSTLVHDVASRHLLRNTRMTRNVAPWRSTSSTDSSNGGFPESISRAISLDVDSSSSSTPDEIIPGFWSSRRRSSALHSVLSSRRSSTLHGQSSFASDGGEAPGFCGHGRRRSSGTSDASQRSSGSSSGSAKRSSTDYSSEMEEYFENFQRSNIKTVIEEESGAASFLDDDGDVAGASGGSGSPTEHDAKKSRLIFSRSVKMFSVERPTNVERPTAVRLEEPISEDPGTLGFPVTRGHNTVLDHFVDNLINEVAQDSKIEIEELVREQHLMTTDGSSSSAPIDSDAQRRVGKRIVKFRNCSNEGSRAASEPPRGGKGFSPGSENTGLGLGGEKAGLGLASMDWFRAGSDEEMLRRDDEEPYRCRSSDDHYSSSAGTFESTRTNVNEMMTRMRNEYETNSRFDERRKNSSEAANLDENEEFDAFVTDFVTGVFRDAVSLFQRHFVFSNVCSGRCRVDEFWVSPTTTSRRTKRNSLPTLPEDDLTCLQIPQQRRRHSEFHVTTSAGFYAAATETGSSSADGRRAKRRPSKDVKKKSFDDDADRPLVSGFWETMVSDFKHRLRGPDAGSTCDDDVRPRMEISENVDNRASRRLLDGWFDGVAFDKPLSNVVGSFVHGLLVGAFGDALVELFGTSSLETATANGSRNLVSPFAVDNYDDILDYASDLSESILTAGCREAARRLAAGGAHRGGRGQLSKGSSLTNRSISSSRLESIASEFANQLIDEAIQLVTSADGQAIVNEQTLLRPVVTGHSAVGAYADEPQLFAVLQWLSASMASVPQLNYNTLRNTHISQLDAVFCMILGCDWTVGELLSEVLVWCRDRQDRDRTTKMLFDFLLERLQ